MWYYMMIQKALIESYSLIWDMYQEAIKEIPDIEWKTGEIEYLTPSRIMYHVIETGEFYSGYSKEFDWGHRFNVECWEATGEALPGKDETLEYHKEVRSKITEWVTSLNDEDFLEPEIIFKWTGSTLLSRLLYLLSHYHQHFGEINAELCRRNLPRIMWKTF
jgi:hypothetical protein